MTDERIKAIVEQLATRDVYEVAERFGVKIVYQWWFPVTFGEYDSRRRTICVNLNAHEKREKIIAHELGHFFAADFKLNKIEEEIFAREFAARFGEFP